jgi:hypothetical protein
MKVFTKADKPLFLENILKQGIKGEALYLLEKGYASYKFENELKVEMNLCNYTMFIESGKIYFTFDLILI